MAEPRKADPAQIANSSLPDASAGTAHALRGSSFAAFASAPDGSPAAQANSPAEPAHDSPSTSGRSPGGSVGSASGGIPAVGRPVPERRSSERMEVVAGGAPQERTVISKRATPPEPKVIPKVGGPMELGRSLEGTQLGHFLLEKFVGGGGMGAVFRAVDTKLSRIVAVKVMARDRTDDDTLRRFQNEAQSAARLDHPNIARVHYVGEDEGLNYIVFEYIEGTNIRDVVIQRGPLPLDEAINYTLQVAEALEHAFQRDVVHRDIKPSNVLVMANGHVKLVDMGLARMHQVEASNADLTATGVTLGTFDYISPEQARDPRSADVRSDLYSLGCTLYYMLTGRPPFPDGTVLQKLLSHSGDAPPDVRAYRPELSEEVSLVVQRLLAKQPAQRYQTPSELIGALLLLADGLGLDQLARSGRVWVASPTNAWTVLERQLPWAVPTFLFVVLVVLLRWGWNSTGDREDRPLRPSYASPVARASNSADPKSTDASADSSTAKFPTESGTSRRTNDGANAGEDRNSAVEGRGGDVREVGDKKKFESNVATPREDGAGADKGSPAERDPTEATRAEPGVTDSKTGDTGKSDPARVEASKPDMPKTDISKAEASKTDMSKTDMSRPEISRPDASRNEAAGAEVARSEGGKSETGKLEVAKDTSKAEASGEPKRPDDANSPPLVASTNKENGKETNADSNKETGKDGVKEAGKEPSRDLGEKGSTMPATTEVAVKRLVVGDMRVDEDGDPVPEAADVRRFDYLQEAFRAAVELPAVDTIELRFDGPRTTRPIDVSLPSRRVTVKAAAGRQPTVLFQPSAGESTVDRRMIRVLRTALVWEDIPIQLDLPDAASDDWTLFFLDRPGRVEVNHATLTIREQDATRRLAQGVAFFRFAEQVASETMMDMRPSRESSPTHIHLQQCIVRGPGTLVRCSTGVPFRLSWQQGLFASTAGLLETQGARVLPQPSEVVSLDLSHLTLSIGRPLCHMRLEPETRFPLEFVAKVQDCIFLKSHSTPGDTPGLTVFEQQYGAGVDSTRYRPYLSGSGNYYPDDTVLLRISPIGNPTTAQEYSLRNRHEARQEKWYDEQPSPGMVMWRQLPASNTPVERQSKIDYQLDDTPDNPAGQAGFDPQQLPD